MLIREESVFEAYIFSRNWPKLQEYSKYPSQTKWIWQFFRETMLPPLQGSGALAVIALAPASIIKSWLLPWSQPRFCFTKYFSSCMFNMESRLLLNLSPGCTKLHLRELQSQKFSRRSIRLKLPRKVRRSPSWWALSSPYCQCQCILYL